MLQAWPADDLCMANTTHRDVSPLAISMHNTLIFSEESSFEFQLKIAWRLNLAGSPQELNFDEVVFPVESRSPTVCGEL